MDLSKEQFWYNLRNPMERNCGNCEHQDKTKFRTCTRPTVSQSTYDCVSENYGYWKWNNVR